MRINGAIVSILLLALFASGSPRADTLSPHYEKADSLLIVKSERKLYLLKEGEVLRDFDIALGLMPEGPKQREGDFRTPEGLYYLDARNPNSDYFLSLQISYPNPQDVARARSQGAEPGGQIMIHGQPNEPKYSESRYENWDWTDGCVAVSNSDMVDIWLMTEEGTPIEIRP
ncbi:MAG: L,D-transpeptidase family protein [Gammaproteobacteria bacterium]|nr:L,D-transpeptidase family protein [Gammaproteobacteria bacterium]